MKLSRRKAMLFAAAFGVGGAALTGFTSSSAVPECKIAHDWAAANSKSLPTSYARFGSYDLTFRKAIFSALTPTAQLDLWKVHLTRIAVSAELSVEQRALLDTVRSRLAVYLDPATGRTAVEHDKIAERVKTVFGKKLAKTVFFTLGPESQSGQASPTFKQASMLSGAETVIKFVAKKLGLAGAVYSDCDCATQHDWCTDQYHVCVLSGYFDMYCNATDHGCGFLWLYGCDGTCWYNGGVSCPNPPCN